MLIIKNEREHAEKMLEKGFLLKSKLSFELSILYKYFKALGVQEKEIENRLHDFCKFWMQSGYNYVKFIKVIDRVKANSRKGFLKEEREVYFTARELSLLINLENKSLEKVLFMLMFFGKLDGHNYCNVKESELFKMATVCVKTPRRTEIMRELYVRGFIKPTMTGGDKVLCIEEENEEQSERVLVIDRLENPIVYYHAWCGDKVIKTCEDCGIMIEAKSNNTKYCKECKEKRILAGRREYYEKKKASLE